MALTRTLPAPRPSASPSPVCLRNRSRGRWRSRRSSFPTATSTPVQSSRAWCVSAVPATRPSRKSIGSWLGSRRSQGDVRAEREVSAGSSRIANDRPADPPPVHPIDDIVMAIAAGEAEIAIDSLEAVRAFYPRADLWLLDDCTTDGTADRVGEWARLNGARFQRNPVHRGYYGNAHSIFRLMHLAATSGREYRWVLKL